MQLPNSFAPTLAAFNSDYGSVQVQSKTTTASVVSWLDLISGLGASQLTVANQPTLSITSGQHNYLAFGGSANLGFNSLSSKVGSAWTVYLVATVTTPSGGAQDLFSFGTSTSAVDGYAQLYVSGSAAFANFHNNAGAQSQVTGGTVNNKLHLYTMSYGGGHIQLKLDGTSLGTAAISGAISFDRCTFGALSANGSVSRNLTGSINELAVFGGTVDTNVETYFLNKYSL